MDAVRLPPPFVPLGSPSLFRWLSRALDRPLCFFFFLRSDNDITDVIENNFTTEEERFGEIITIPLIPGGETIEVTQANKREYVEAITEYRIAKRVEEQFGAFMSGFNELIPQDLINVFDERELELLIGGMADIDVDDWKKHTDYVRPLLPPLPRPCGHPRC